MNKENALILDHKVRFLFGHGRWVWFSSAATSLLLAAVLYKLTNPAVLICWIVANTLITSIRVWLGHYYLNRPHTRPNNKLAFRIFYGLFLASGLTWGAAGWLFYQSATAPETLFLLLILCVIAISALMILSITPYLYSSFLVLVLGPVFVRIVMGDTLVAHASATLIALLVLSLSMAGQRLNKVVTSSLGLKQELAKAYHIDDLTGLPDKRFFEQTFVALWQQAQLEQAPLSVVRVDLTLTHEKLPAEITVALASVFSRQVNHAIRRASDMVASLTPAIVLVLLPATSNQGARQAAQNIQARLATPLLEFAQDNKITVEPPRVTVETFHPEDSQPYPGLLERLLNPRATGLF